MKWLRRILLGALVLVVLVVAVVYAWSSLLLNRIHTVEPRSVLLSSRPEVLAHGERMAQVFGCFRGCHGDEMQGQLFFEEDWLARIVAPSLGSALERYSITQLEAIIRQGVRSDGTGVLGMPSAAFSVMSDRDLSAVLSFIRDFGPEDAKPGTSRIGPLGRLGLVLGWYSVEASKVMHRPVAAADLGTPGALGEYLAIAACSECHGADFSGQEGFTPSLAVVEAYSLADFKRLMKEGVALGGRELGLMGGMARRRFSHLEGHEVEALHAFLSER